MVGKDTLVFRQKYQVDLPGFFLLMRVFYGSPFFPFAGRQINRSNVNVKMLSLTSTKGSDNSMNHNTRFWEVKSLNEMTEEEWESLCDCCGQCCLHKIEDPDSGEIFYTYVACQYLDLDTCQCMFYENRLELVVTCVKITAENFDRMHLLPNTCAYRRLSEGKRLPDWHPLISRDPSAVHHENISIRGKVIPEQNIREQDFEEFIIDESNKE